MLQMKHNMYWYENNSINTIHQNGKEMVVAVIQVELDILEPSTPKGARLCPPPLSRTSK